MFLRKLCFASFIFWEVKLKTEFLENPKNAESAVLPYSEYSNNLL